MRSNLNRFVGCASALGIVFGLAACSGADGAQGTGGAPGASGDTGAAGTAGSQGPAGAQGAAGAPGVVVTPTTAANAVYTTSNDPSFNAIYVYDRANDGSLTAHGAYETGGKGTGASLGDQGALAFSSAKNMFLAVNAGDNSVSMMSLEVDGSLRLISKVASGGVDPISVTVSGSSVYVLNAGDGGANAANISGFTIDAGGLLPTPSSTQPLSNASPGPAQIQFTPNGKIIVVTEKATSMIDTYVVTAGVAAAPNSQPSVGSTPFGFAFNAGGDLVVSEAGPGAASSYTIDASGTLTAVSDSIVSSQAAPCWVATAGNNAFVANAHSNSISGYSIGASGALTLAGNGITAQTGATPLDLAANAAGDFLYQINAGDHSLSIYSIAADGSLGVKPVFTGLPVTAAGLVVR